MNYKQAIALAIGTLAAILLVELPKTSTKPQLVSHQTLSNGQIVATYQSHIIYWQPAVFVLVLLITGYSIMRLRNSPQ